MLADTDAYPNSNVEPPMSYCSRCWTALDTQHRMCCPAIVLTCANNSHNVGRHGCGPEFDNRAIDVVLLATMDMKHTRCFQDVVLTCALNSYNVGRHGCVPEFDSRAIDVVLLAELDP